MKQTNALWLWIAALLAIVLGTTAILVISGKLRFGSENQQPAQTATLATPTPTPIRIPSALATQSAFLALEQGVASLSAQITATQIQDQTLTPPVLDLPLGFSQ